MRCDLIPPKLVKIVTDQLEEPLTYISFQTNPKKLPLNQLIKWETINTYFLKYRPVSVLNTFSKIIEISIFDQITICANEFLSVFYGGLL